jgi:hypothetical protein
MAKEWANKDKYHPSDGVLESRVQMPRAKASVRTVRAWGKRKVVGGAAAQATPVRPVWGTGQTGAGLDRQQFGFRARIGARVVSGGRGSGGWAGEFAGGQVARHSPTRVHYGMGGVVALRRRGGMVHGLSFVVLVLLKAERGGSLRVVTVVVFVEVALVGEMLWLVLTPLSSKWLGTGLTLLVLTPVLSCLFAHVLVFEFQVGDLKNIWLIYSGCSRHMTGDKGWFSSLVPVVTRRYITFGDNGHGRVLSEGEIKVSDKITLGMLLLFNRWGTICFLCPSCWMRALRCCFSEVVLGFWTLEGTLSVWSFPRVRCFVLILLSLRVWSVVSWLVLRVSCGSGIGSWVT